MIYVLYNKTAGAHYGVENIRQKIEETFPGEEMSLESVLNVESKQEYISKIDEGDRLVLVGGDGTLNHFVNEVEEKDYPFPIYCFAGGTGNDFMNDVLGTGVDTVVQINDYIRDLPILTVNGKEYRFLNGAGFGLDGWCCAEGNVKRDKTGRPPNYTTIALKGLLYKFKPATATITVDGRTEVIENAWTVPTMLGKYFGGGMKLTPGQDRKNEEGLLSVACLTSKSRIKILPVFAKVFKGDHIKHTNIFKVIRGRDIHVKFDSPTAMQIDGETITDVLEYSVKFNSNKKEEATV